MGVSDHVTFGNTAIYSYSRSHWSV